MSKLGPRAKIAAACAVALLGVAVYSSHCTDANLYGKGLDVPLADRVGIKGRVCTDDPQQTGFPVKVLFLVDAVAGPLHASFDPEKNLVRVLKEAALSYGGDKSFRFALARFAGASQPLPPETDVVKGRFVSPGEIEGYIDQIAQPQPCVPSKCRSYVDALDLAQGIIEGDIARIPNGEKIHTQYVVVMIAAGPPDPLAYRCEEGDVDTAPDSDSKGECMIVPLKGCSQQDWGCTQSLMANFVVDLRETIEGKGASSFSLHTLFLATGPDEKNKDPAAWATVLTETEKTLKQMAFVGGGRFVRFNNADAFSLDSIELRKMTMLFEPKGLIVSNINTKPSPSGLLTDSDGDGLDDQLEKKIKTSLIKSDSDGDGLSDLVEYRFSRNPTKKEPPPEECEELDGPPYGDFDADRLNDCEELFIGTDYSLADTDGDGLMDWIEVVLKTNHLLADILEDYDKDGTPDGDEVRNHTDPSSNDAAGHLGSSYRYETTNEPISREASFSQLKRLTGVTPLTVGAETSGGRSSISYQPEDKAKKLPPRLRWKDYAQGETYGREVRIDTKKGKAEYQLKASSMDKEGAERWLRVEVDPAALPPKTLEEELNITWTERQCMNFVVRNIRLVETLAKSGPGGINNIYAYFAEAPHGQLTSPSVFRVAHLIVEYHEDTGRKPNDLLIEVKDEDFEPIGF